MDLLTSRELKVLKLVCADYKNIEIAEKIGHGLRYTEKIKASLYHKTKTHSSIGLLKWAVKNSLYKI